MSLHSCLTYHLYQEMDPWRTHLRITNLTDYPVVELESRGVLISFSGLRCVLELKQVSTIPAKSNVGIEYGDWADLAIAHLDVRYFLASDETVREVEDLRSQPAGFELPANYLQARARGAYQIDHVT